MAEVIIMPKLGFNMSEGQLVKWHKKVGDSITKGEVIFEINTDKTTMPVEATVDGVLLKIMLEEGAFADVFTPIAVIGQPGEDAETAIAADGGRAAADRSVSALEAPPAGAPVEPAEIKAIKLTPKAKKLVAEEDIHTACLAGIKGTGYQGGITAGDIKASPLAKKAAGNLGVELMQVEGSGVRGKIMKADVMSAAHAAAPVENDRKVLEVKPYKGTRRIIGEKLSQSKYTAPHLYFTDSVDTTNMTAFRKLINETGEAKIAVSDLLTMAAAKAILKYPIINSSLVDGRIITYRSANIGTAVAGKNGLVVPVIRDVQEKSLADVAAESRDLVARARGGRLAPGEYSGGTFTISNLGMFGIENFTAIINAPEAAILAVSSVRKTPVVVAGENGGDSIVIRPMMNIQLSVDHRIIDGLDAARFVGCMKDLLENPIKILV